MKVEIFVSCENIANENIDGNYRVDENPTCHNYEKKWEDYSEEEQKLISFHLNHQGLISVGYFPV